MLLFYSNNFYKGKDSGMHFGIQGQWNSGNPSSFPPAQTPAEKMFPNPFSSPSHSQNTGGEGLWEKWVTANFGWSREIQQRYITGTLPLYDQTDSCCFLICQTRLGFASRKRRYGQKTEFKIGTITIGVIKRKGFFKGGGGSQKQTL